MTDVDTHIDDGALFIRIAEDDEDAFRILYRRYGKLLFPFLNRLTRSDELTEDLIQEALLRVWMNRDQLTGVDHPRAWIYRIASNLALNWLEREGIHEKAMEQIGNRQSPVGEDPYASLTVRAIRNVVRQALADLPERRRLIYRMHREEGLRAREIAEQLGISESTVKNTLIAAARFIREKVEKAGYTLPLWLILLLF